MEIFGEFLKLLQPPNHNRSFLEGTGDWEHHPRGGKKYFSSQKMMVLIKGVIGEENEKEEISPCLLRQYNIHPQT